MEQGPKLAAMANQIATFFRPYEEDEAVAGIRDHIASFWTRAMRRDLLAALHGGSVKLDPRVVLAVDVPEAGDAPAPTRREAAGPSEVGELASDAG